MSTTIIVGSGVAGGIVCKEILKDERQSVVLVEAGPKIPTRSYRAWLDLVNTGRTPYDPFVDTGTNCENIGPHDLILKNSRVFAQGGTTLHWEGCCPRLAPEDFYKKTLTGLGIDWPFDGRYLDPYLNQAEELLGISGNANRSAVPRTRSFPMPSLAPGLIDRAFIAACDQLGWSSEQIPIARYVLPGPGHAVCQSTGTCRYCPVGGRFSGDQLLEGLNTNPRFSVVRSIVSRIVLRDHREATGVECLDPTTGQTRILEADRIVLAAGTLESTKILLASRIGNRSGHLGRHLAAHPLLKLRVGIRENPGRISQEIHFPTWCSREFDGLNDQKSAKMIIFPFGGPSVDFARMIAEGQTSDALDSASRGPAELLLAGLCEMQESERSRVELTSGKTALGLPRTRLFFEWEKTSLDATIAHEQTLRQLAQAMGWTPIDFSVDQSSRGRIGVRADHATGTCRISRDEADGVVDVDLRVHGTDNVWVCSNAVIPSPGAANPTLTLAALALRLGEHIGKAAA